MRRSAFFILFSLVSACGVHSNPAAPAGQSALGIIGGEPVSSDSPIAKSVVAIIGNNGDREYLCTGVLISPNKVLTAAHCGLDMKSGLILFSTDLNSPDRRFLREVSGVTIQPGFNETLSRLETRQKKTPNSIKNWGDLAVLSFEGKPSKGYRPVQISGEADVNNGDLVMLAGYGTLNGVDRTPAQNLNAVTVEVKKARYSKSEFTVDQTESKGACHGDSGGPAFVVRNNEFVLVGITSRGFDEACRKATIYTRVSTFLDWIKTAMSESEKEMPPVSGEHS